MSAEGEEVAIHRLHIHLEMGCTLGTIHQHRDTALVGYLYNFLHRINRSQHVADVSDADDLGAR